MALFCLFKNFFPDASLYLLCPALRGGPQSRRNRFPLPYFSPRTLAVPLVHTHHLSSAEDRVVLEQVGHRLRVAEIVDGDELDVRSALSRGPEEVPSDPPETVDPHPYAHRSPPSWTPAGSLATGVRMLALEPTFVILAASGSALVRCRIQTPSGAQVQSAVKSEGEIVLGASPPTRSIPGENALAFSPEKLVPSLRSG